MPALRHYLHLHFIVFIWGFTAILGLLLEPLGTPALVVWRTGLAALGLAVVVAARLGQPPAGAPPLTSRQRTSDRRRMLATGGLIALHWFTFFLAARLANASVCLAGMATSSLWASVLEPLLLKRAINRLEVLMGAVVLLGLYLIFRFEFDKGLGLAVAVFSAMLGALFTIINSGFAQRHDSLQISALEMGGAFLTSLLFFPFLAGLVPGHGPVVWAELLPQRPDQWLWLGVLAFVCTVYAYTAGLGLLRRFSPYMAILTINLEPVYGILLAVLIFNDRERMTPGFYVGTLVILLAVLAYPFLAKKE